jgi:hypothetical protein
LLMAVCNDDAIQKKLPQLLIVSEQIVTLAEFAAIGAFLPKNVFIKRRRTAWNTSELFIEYLGLLKTILTPYKDSTQFIFTCDAVPLHVHPTVLDALNCPEMLYFMLVPSKLTWLLQPLDVGVFGKLKKMLRRISSDDILEPSDEKAIVRMIRSLCHVLAACIDSYSTRKIFRQCGLAASQHFVSSHITKELKIEHVPEIPSTRPDDRQLQICWPSNRSKITYADIARTQPRPDEELLAIAAGSVTVGDPAGVSEVAIIPGAIGDHPVEHHVSEAELTEDEYMPESPAPATPVGIGDPFAFAHPSAESAAASHEPSSSSAVALRRRCSFKQPG